MDDLYQERIAGALLGDVFEIGADDILALRLSATGGLQKVSGELSALVDPLDALILTAAGLGITNATKIKHGALPILSDVATEFLNGKGLWVAALSAALYDANTIIKADTDNTPVALPVGEQTLVGRITGGAISALTVDQIHTLLGQYQHTGNVLDDGTFDLPAITNGGRGILVVGADEERADFSIKSDGTVNLIMASTNVVANIDTDGKFCVGTSVASPCVIKNRLAATKAVMLQIWYN